MSHCSRQESPANAPQLTSRLACLDGSAGILAQLQTTFETARDQFDEDALNIAARVALIRAIIQYP